MRKFQSKMHKIAVFGALISFKNRRYLFPHSPLELLVWPEIFCSQYWHSFSLKSMCILRRFVLHRSEFTAQRTRLGYSSPHNLIEFIYLLHFYCAISNMYKYHSMAPIYESSNASVHNISLAGERRVQGGKAILKKWVLSLDRKEETEVVVRTTAGIKFHILGAATENARLPVGVLVLGIKRAEVRDDLEWWLDWECVHAHGLVPIQWRQRVHRTTDSTRIFFTTQSDRVITIDWECVYAHGLVPIQWMQLNSFIGVKQHSLYEWMSLWCTWCQITQRASSETTRFYEWINGNEMTKS